MAPLDPIGNISLAIQIIILFLLILGLPFFRRERNQKNLIAHGYFTVAALVLHTILIFIVMVPSFNSGLGELGNLSLFNAVTVWSHVILGSAAEVLGIIIITGWLSKGPTKLACWKLRTWMIPTFVIWVISIVNGALVHILGML
jgi:hypothetical protein